LTSLPVSIPPALKLSFSPELNMFGAILPRASASDLHTCHDQLGPQPHGSRVERPVPSMIL